MFGTRLNPTKPPASHRAVLERVGAVCRELVAHGRSLCDVAAADLEAAFEQYRLTGLGVPKDQGGLGDEPLLAVLAAERLGRGGWPLARWFASRTAAQWSGQFAAEGTESSPSGHDEPAALGELPDAELARRLSLDDSLWRATSPEFMYWLNLKLCMAAGGIGIVSDCLEAVLGQSASPPSTERSMQSADGLGLQAHVARSATDLECVRAVTYAAAELKSEFDCRPGSDHLRLEAGTLVNQALCSSLRSVAALLERSERVTLAGRPLVESLAAPHRVLRENAFLSSGVAESLDRQIARYYLSE